MPKISAALKQALRQRAVRPVRLVEVDHPSGLFHAWNGIGQLEYDGKTWLGPGYIGAISGLRSTSTPQITSITAQLIVTPEAYEQLSDAVRGRAIKDWRGALNDQHQVVGTQLLGTYIMDTQTSSITDDGNYVVSITAQGGMHMIERANPQYYSPEALKAAYPSATGADLLHLMENKDDTWRAS
ncbi:MAG: hypothetical protein AAF234_15955 [Pseudomonadota bacterium]